MMLLWQFRDDPSVVQFMAQFVAKVRKLSIEAVHYFVPCTVYTFCYSYTNTLMYSYILSLQEVAMSFEESNFIFRNWHT